VRITYTLNTGIYWYSIAVLAFEFTASSSMIVHGLGLLRVRDMRGRAAVRAAGPVPLASPPACLRWRRAHPQRSARARRPSHHGRATYSGVCCPPMRLVFAVDPYIRLRKQPAQLLARHAGKGAGCAARAEQRPVARGAGAGRHAAMPRI